MKRFVQLFAIAVCAGLLAMGVAQETPRGQIRGHVVTSENGLPLPKVRVTLERTEMQAKYEDEDESDQLAVRTDSEGNFSFPYVPVGQYRLEVSARYHHGTPTVFNIGEGERRQMDLRVDPDEPSMNAYFSQQVWLPTETPKFELDGFITEKTVNMHLYKVSEDELINAGGRDNFFSAYRTGEYKGLPEKQILQWDYQPQNRDVEGHFVEQIRLDKLPVGFYYLTAEAGKLTARGFLNVTTLGLVTRSDSAQTLCYVADLTTGAPLSGVSVYAVAGNARTELGKTDAGGQLAAPKASGDNPLARSFFAYSGTSLAICEGDNGGRAGLGHIAVVTDRPVYRPGDTVQFKGIVRLLKGTDYALPPAGAPVKIAISDGDGNAITTVNTNLNAHGTFHGSWTGSTELKPGSYDMSIDVAGVSDSETISIAAYRKPEFSVAVTPVKDRYSMGETGQAKVKCAYYYGAPVVGAKVSATIFRNPLWTNDDDLSDDGMDDSYDDGEDGGAGGGEFVQTLEAITDSNGEATISVPLSRARADAPAARNDNAHYDYSYSVQATVNDTSGKGFDGSASFNVTQGDFAVRLSPQKWFGSVGDTVDVDLKANFYGGDKKPAANRPIEVQVDKTRYLRAGGTETTHLTTLSATTDASGRATLHIPLSRSGSLHVIAVGHDDGGREIDGETNLYAYGRGVTPDQSDDSEDDQSKFEVTLDKKSYHVGDTAKVLVKSSFGPGTALLCVDGDGILSHQTVPIDSTSGVAEIRITQEMTPNAFLSVVALKGKKLYTAGSPIVLDWTARDLTVKLSSDATQYKPGGVANVTVQTLDDAGHPVPAELSLGVVDESIYAIRKDTLNMRREFYPKRQDNVMMRYSFEDIYLDGGDKSPANIPVRRQFRDTADWRPEVQTGPDGKAVVALNLPENLTSWRVTAVGVTDRTDVGKGVLNFRTWKPLMVRLDAPGFLVKDDVQQVVVGVTNDTDEDADVKVTLQADNGALDHAGAVTQHIAARQQADLTWTYTASTTGMGKLTAYAQTANANDAMEQTFAIVPRGAATLENHSSRVTTDQTVKFTVLPGVDPRYGDLRLRVSPSLVGGMTQALDQLIDFPYGCVEQTLDRFVPSLVVNKLVTDLHLPKPKRLDKVPEIARQGLDRLAAMQHADGSWGWWNYDDGNAFMTYLVVDGLDRAKEQGYVSNQIHMDSALAWMAKQITDAKAKPLKDYERLALAVALARHGKAAEAKVALAKFDHDLAGPAEWSLAARAYAALGDVAQRNACVDHLHHTVQVDGEEAKWLGQGWTDGDTNTGFAFQALSEIDSKDPVLIKVLQYLMDNRSSGAWSTTLATAQILTGMDQVVRANGEATGSGQLEVSLNGHPLTTMPLGAEGLSSPATDLKVPRANLVEGENTLTFHLAGTGVAYYSATLRQFTGAPATTGDPAALGMKITRNYRLLKPGRTPDGTIDLIPSAQPVSSAQTGDVVVCELVIDNPTPRSFVFIEDPIPSNCHVTQQTTFDMDSNGWPYWYSGMQILDDRVGVFARDLVAGQSKLTYYFRAETPGMSHALPTQATLMYSPGRASTSAEGPMEIHR